MAEILKELARYEVSPSSGFLPTSAPLERLPHAYYEPWETLGSLLPHLIKDGVHRDHIAVLPLLTTTFLSTVEEWRRAYVVLGYLSNAYIFCHHPPSEKLPACLAEPMITVSAHLGIPCVPTYAGQTLWNYRLLPRHEDRPYPIDRLQALVTFTGSSEESAFFCTSVAIEQCGAPLIPAFLHAVDAAWSRNVPLVTSCLYKAEKILKAMTSLLPEIYSRCSPSFFYHTLRPYLEGTRDLQSVGLPNGVFFETASTGQTGSYQKYRGPSNAQSALFPFIDIALGVKHEKDGFLDEMREYMPGPHRNFLKAVERVANIRDFVSAASSEDALDTAYRASLAALADFRQKHIQIVTSYVTVMSRRAKELGHGTTKGHSIGSPISISGSQGTGGTNPVEFLKSVRDDVLDVAQVT